jgi:hypothetical protein
VLVRFQIYEKSNIADEKQRYALSTLTALPTAASLSLVELPLWLVEQSSLVGAFDQLRLA